MVFFLLSGAEVPGVRGNGWMRDKLLALLEPGIEALGYETAELEFHAHRGGGVLRIYIDLLGGEDETRRVSVEDCEAVSRMASQVLDAADPIAGEYTLEVSSPGFDRPLSKPVHFARQIGGRVHVESHLPRDGRRRWTGELMEVGDEGIRLRVDGQDVMLGFREIKSARLVPEYGTRRE